MPKIVSATQMTNWHRAIIMLVKNKCSTQISYAFVQNKLIMFAYVFTAPLTP